MRIMAIGKIHTKIESIVGNVITVKAEGVRNGDLAEITSGGKKSLANVIKLDNDKVSLQVFAGGQGVSTGDSVKFLGVPMRVSASENMLGRILPYSAQEHDTNGNPDDRYVQHSRRVAEASYLQRLG